MQSSSSTPISSSPFSSIFPRLVVALAKTGIFALLYFVLFPHSAYAQGTQWSGRCVMSGTDVATIQGFECLFANILEVVVVLAGFAFFFMFASGGFQYLLSQGDAKKAAAASNTLTMSIIGLVGVVASFLILRLITNFTGVDVTNFLIPG